MGTSSVQLARILDAYSFSRTYDDQHALNLQLINAHILHILHAQSLPVFRTHNKMYASIKEITISMLPLAGQLSATLDGRTFFYKSANVYIYSMTAIYMPSHRLD